MVSLLDLAGGAMVVAAALLVDSWMISTWLSKWRRRKIVVRLNNSTLPLATPPNVAPICLVLPSKLPCPRSAIPNFYPHATRDVVVVVLPC